MPAPVPATCDGIGASRGEGLPCPASEVSAFATAPRALSASPLLNRPCSGKAGEGATRVIARTTVDRSWLKSRNTPSLQPAMMCKAVTATAPQKRPGPASADPATALVEPSEDAAAVALEPVAGPLAPLPDVADGLAAGWPGAGTGDGDGAGAGALVAAAGDEDAAPAATVDAAAAAAAAMAPLPVPALLDRLPARPRSLPSSRT